MIRIEKLTDESYHSIQGFNKENKADSTISASLLKRVVDEGIMGAIHNEVSHDSTTLENFRIGTLIHTYLLEYEAFNEEYYIGDIDPMESRERIDTDIGNMLTAIRKDIAKKYPFFFEKGENELSIMGAYQELNVKSKIDKFYLENRKIKIFDLKSIGIALKKVSAYELKKTILKYHYDLQLAFYADLAIEFYKQSNEYLECECYILFVSKIDNCTRLVRLSDETIGYGREKLTRAWHDTRNYVNDDLDDADDAILI